MGTCETSPRVYLVVPPGGCFPETRRIELGPGALTIGRSEGCEIRVDVPGVDQEHAKISEVALIALGPDCAIGDVPLDPGSRRLVMPGDEIQIGSVVVALEGRDPSLAPPPLDAQITQPIPGAPAAPAAPAPPAPFDAPRVRVVEGATFGDELVLTDEGREYVIGRGPKCDLVLDDREVSREHVKLKRQGYSIFVQDLSSTRGSWLGRAAVYTGATVEWARPRMLRVGATVLSLDLPEAIRRSIPGAQASAPMTPPPRSRNKAGFPNATPSATGGSQHPNAPTPAPSRPPPRSVPPGGSTPAPAPYAPSSASGTPPPPQAGHATPRGLGSLPPASPSRKAWKKSGPTIGRASGLLLLALAGLVILGGLFVVFSLLE
jgi:pSer/pThr/pTyr-binding forkhead associated (FHA) protein